MTHRVSKVGVRVVYGEEALYLGEEGLGEEVLHLGEEELSEEVLHVGQEALGEEVLAEEADRAPGPEAHPNASAREISFERVGARASVSVGERECVFV